MTDKATQYFLLALSSLAVLYFAVEVRIVLSPLLMLIVVVFLLYPIRDNFYANRLLWITAVLFVVWFAKVLSGLLAPFIIGFVLAYLFEPLVERLVKWRLSRSTAALLITLFGVGGLILAVVFITPLISDQISALTRALAMLPAQTETLFNDIMTSPLAQQLGLDLRAAEQSLLEWLRSRTTDIGSITAEALGAVAGSIPQLLSALIDIILVPFLSYYFLTDFPIIQSTVQDLVPRTYRDTFREYAILGSDIVRQYLRGQLIVMLILIALYSISFSFIGLRYSLLVGIVYGVMSFIPYIGGIVAFAVSAIVALFGENVPTTLFLIALIYAAGHLVENFILVPKIIGEKVKLNPIVLFLAIFLFGYFFGFLGVLLAVPLSAFLIAAFRKRFLEPREAVVAQSAERAAVEEEVKEL